MERHQQIRPQLQTTRCKNRPHDPPQIRPPAPLKHPDTPPTIYSNPPKRFRIFFKLTSYRDPNPLHCLILTG